MMSKTASKRQYFLCYKTAWNCKVLLVNFLVPSKDYLKVDSSFRCQIMFDIVPFISLNAKCYPKVISEVMGVSSFYTNGEMQGL